jgi:phosphoribosylformylglycinamidine (FGAM) synthase PurS component
MVWIIAIKPKDKSNDWRAIKLENEAFELLNKKMNARSLFCYILEGRISKEEAKQIAEEFIVDPIVEDYYLFESEEEIYKEFEGLKISIHYKKGFINPDDEIIQRSLRMILGDKISNLKTFLTYLIEGINEEEAKLVAEKILANKLIHDVIIK